MKPLYLNDEFFDFLPPNYNILIVEDSKSLSNILLNKFRGIGYNCIHASSIEEANKILDEAVSIHYVMLDINLPDGNGYELIKKLKDTKTKIFVITTEKDEEFRQITFQKGIIDFILKDKNFFYRLDEISNTIKKLEKNKNSNILVIDDSFVIREKLGYILKNRNYNVIVEDNTKNALEIIEKENIDLILLDINLKDENGIDFLKKNKSEIIDRKRVPVLIISGNIEASTIRDSLKAGATDVIRKPYIIEELVLKVDTFIDYKRNLKENNKAQLLLKQYKDTVDRSQIVSKADKDGIITYVNDSFCKASGYSKYELIGKSHNIIKHPDNDPKIYEDIWHTIKELKEPWRGEIKNKRKDGSFYWVKTTINPILDEHDNVKEYIAVRIDITEDKLIKDYFQKQLNDSTLNLNQSIKISSEYKMAINESSILTRFDLNGIITHVNNKLLDVSGYHITELLNKEYRTLFYKKTEIEIYDEIWNTIKNGTVWKGIVENKAKDNESFWLDTTIVPIKNINEEIVEFMAISTDLTELFSLHNEIEDTQREVIYKLGEIGETRSLETGNHVKRVAEYSKLLALLYGLDKHQANILFTASPMHDIGKVGITDDILKKPSGLTSDEFEIMKTHAQIGYNILKNSKREVLKAAAVVAHEHHEKWDGTGYPQGLKGEDIHIFGRITALADVFDALGSDRYYKKAWRDKDILNLLKEQRGKQFDPKLVDLFFEYFETFLEIRDKYRD